MMATPTSYATHTQPIEDQTPSDGLHSPRLRDWHAVHSVEGASSIENPSLPKWERGGEKIGALVFPTPRDHRA